MTAQPRLAVDTSVAVPLLVASHEAHDTVKAWGAGRALSLSGHSLAETYAVLTRLPGDARVAPVDAASLIDDNFVEHLPLPPELALTIHQGLARRGISGGATYDVMVALAAREHGALLATRDARALPTYEASGARVEVIGDTGDLT